MTSRPEVGLHTAPFGQSEDGILITNQDAEEICQHLDCSVEYVQCSNGTHRLFVKTAANARATILIFCGGQGEVFVRPGFDFPEKLIFPLTTIEFWNQRDINVIVVDQSYPIPWGWPKLVWVKHVAKIIKYISSSGKSFTDEQRNTKPEIAVASFLADMQDIVKFVADNYPVPLFIAGHCGSAVLVSLFAECYPANLAGLVYWSPFRPLHCDRFTAASVTVPILVTQHRDDRCENTVPATSKLVASDCVNAQYVELHGGIDQGHKDFSIGYHGYRGIEAELVQATASFIEASTINT